MLLIWIGSTVVCAAMTILFGILGVFLGRRFGRYMSAWQCKHCAGTRTCPASDTGAAWPCVHRSKGNGCETCKDYQMCLMLYGGAVPGRCAYWREE